MISTRDARRARATAFATALLSFAIVCVAPSPSGAALPHQGNGWSGTIDSTVTIAGVWDPTMTDSHLSETFEFHASMNLACEGCVTGTLTHSYHALGDGGGCHSTADSTATRKFGVKNSANFNAVSVTSSTSGEWKLGLRLSQASGWTEMFQPGWSGTVTNACPPNPPSSSTVEFTDNEAPWGLINGADVPFNVDEWTFNSPYQLDGTFDAKTTSLGYQRAGDYHGWDVSGSIVFHLKRDKDHDGVIDKNDKCKDTPLGVVVDRNGCPKGHPNCHKQVTLLLVGTGFKPEHAGLGKSNGCWHYFKPPGGFNARPGKWATTTVESPKDKPPGSRHCDWTGEAPVPTPGTEVGLVFDEVNPGKKWQGPLAKCFALYATAPLTFVYSAPSWIAPSKIVAAAGRTPTAILEEAYTSTRSLFSEWKNNQRRTGPLINGELAFGSSTLTAAVTAACNATRTVRSTYSASIGLAQRPTGPRRRKRAPTHRSPKP